MGRIRIVIDAREFVAGRLTGIARFLVGLIDALCESDTADTIVLAVGNADAIPSALLQKPCLQVRQLGSRFLTSERQISNLTRKAADLFISPYPKLPLFGVYCRSVHTVHDVLDLTHPLYRRKKKALFDALRLKRALRAADLTWYDSAWSLAQTKKLVGHTGKAARMRYPGIDDRFCPVQSTRDRNILDKYGLSPGYVLTVGNGLPHKNLGVLLKLSVVIDRKFVFAGVSDKNRVNWQKRFPGTDVRWIGFAADEDLPAILRGAFCLLQPSSAEGYGYPPLEAMACGVPAVVSRIPVLLETTGGRALNADPKDPDDWRDALLRLEDRQSYERRIQEGLKWTAPFKGRDGWKKHVCDIIELAKRNHLNPPNHF